MTSPKNSGSWFAGLTGITLLITAIGAAPPLHSQFGFPIESTLMQCIAWSLTLFMGILGLTIWVMRKYISGYAIALLIASTLLSIGLGEGMLALAGFDSPYHIIVKIPDFVDWATVDSEKGIRFISRPWGNDNWPINSDGFPGTTPFKNVAASAYNTRVLFIGDSFTYGLEATSYANSYVSITEKELQKTENTLVWNASIPGTGQAQQWYSLQQYFPLLKPNVVVLGVCTNDFLDNQYPKDIVYIFKPGKWIFRYSRNSEGDLIELTPEQAYRRAFSAAERPIEYLAASRVGYLLLHSFDLIRRSFSDPPVPSVTTDASTVNIPGYEETKSYLQRIRDYVHEGGASFIIVTIPATSDIIESQGWYLAIFRLCNELDIQYIDPRPNLNISDYVPPPNGHWNNSGHAKVAEMLLPYMKKTLFGNN